MAIDFGLPHAYVSMPGFRILLVVLLISTCNAFPSLHGRIWRPLPFPPLIVTSATPAASYFQQVSSLVPLSMEEAIWNRYACKQFRRFNETLDETSTITTASISDSVVVDLAKHCLSLARRTPTSFNLQPYQVVLVSSPEQKLALSRYCLGPNGQRVRDADCTAVFLADQQVLRTLPQWRQLLNRQESTGNNTTFTARGMWLPIALFSSGYPIPRYLAASLSFVVRTTISFVNLFTTRWLKVPTPTLASAETWASKQVSMVAMTYMLACSSLGLATSPMEGKHAQ
jgi:nitroreductase